jgi:ABC transporter substrate binding protein
MQTSETPTSVGAQGRGATGLGARFDPFQEPYLADPYPFFARARREEPVFYSPILDSWVIARYDDVRRIVTDPVTFSSKNVQSPVRPWPPEAAAMFQAAGLVVRPSLSATDPPQHTVWRTFLRDALALRNGLPTMFAQRQYAEAGGLTAYSADFADLYRRAATFVDKILKGAKPAELPIEQPTKFEFVVNLKTATALGLTIPQSLLMRADRTIE